MQSGEFDGSIKGDIKDKKGYKNKKRNIKKLPLRCGVCAVIRAA